MSRWRAARTGTLAAVGTTAYARLLQLRHHHARRAMKYASVSVVGVAVTQVLLVITYKGLGWPAAWANFVSVSLASVPAYLLNRQWVWGRSGRHRVRREVLPFWGMSILGLIISTVAVGWVSQHWDSQLAVSLTNIASFGVLWVAKYFLLDSVLFGPGADHLHGRPTSPPVSAGMVDDPAGPGRA